MKERICKMVNGVTVKKSLVATAFFIVMLWLIDYSPIGVAGLLKVSGGVSILDFETRYSADFAYDWLTRMSDAGRDFHLTKVMPLDIIYPPSLALFMFMWSSLLAKKATRDNSVCRCLPVLSFVYLLLDWIENVGITSMLIRFPERLDTIAVTTGWVTAVKKTVILCMIVIAIGECIHLLVKKMKGDNGAEIKG